MLNPVSRPKYYTVPVVESTCDILELLREVATPVKMASIADTTGIPLSTTYRIVRTLVDRGYVTRDDEGQYMFDRLATRATRKARAKHTVSPR